MVCLEDNCEEVDNEIAEPEEEDEMADTSREREVHQGTELEGGLDGLDIDDADDTYQGMTQQQLLVQLKKILEGNR